MLVSQPDFSGRLAFVVETNEADYTFPPLVYTEPSTIGLLRVRALLEACRNVMRALLEARRNLMWALLEAPTRVKL
jgi:hypothetical protein